MNFSNFRSQSMSSYSVQYLGQRDPCAAGASGRTILTRVQTPTLACRAGASPARPGSLQRLLGNFRLARLLIELISDSALFNRHWAFMTLIRTKILPYRLIFLEHLAAPLRSRLGQEDLKNKILIESFHTVHQVPRKKYQVIIDLRAVRNLESWGYVLFPQTLGTCHWRRTATHVGRREMRGKSDGRQLMHSRLSNVHSPSSVLGESDMKKYAPSRPPLTRRSLNDSRYALSALTSSECSKNVPYSFSICTAIMGPGGSSPRRQTCFARMGSSCWKYASTLDRKPR